MLKALDSMNDGAGSGLALKSDCHVDEVVVGGGGTCGAGGRAFGVDPECPFELQKSIDVDTRNTLFQIIPQLLQVIDTLMTYGYSSRLPKEDTQSRTKSTFRFDRITFLADQPTSNTVLQSSFSDKSNKLGTYSQHAALECSDEYLPRADLSRAIIIAALAVELLVVGCSSMTACISVGGFSPLRLISPKVRSCAGVCA